MHKKIDSVVAVKLNSSNGIASISQKINVNEKWPTPRLLIRPFRQPNESRQHHLMRLLHENRLLNFKQLTQMLKLPISTLLSFTDQTLRQYLLGVELSNISSPLRRDEFNVQCEVRTWQYSRVCPRCIEEQRPPSLYFDFCLSISCEIHQIFLIDRCPQCQVELTYYRRQYSYCDCGQALAEITTQPTNDVVDLFYRIFAPWRQRKNWHSDESTVIPLESKSFAVLSSILFRVADRRKSQRQRSNWLSLDNWPGIHKLISRWPDSLNEYLFQAVDAVPRKELTRLICRIDIPILPMIGTVARKLYRNQTPRKNATTWVNTENGSCPMVSLNTFGGAVRMDLAGTKRLFESSYFEIKIRTNDEYGHRYWVSQKEFRQLSDWRASTISTTQADQIMRCFPGCARVLVQIGLLNAEFLPGNQQRLRFRREEIDLHLAKLKSLASLRSDLSNELAVLSTIRPFVSSGRNISGKWRRLIHKIFSGETPIYRLTSGKGWDSYGVRTTDI